MIDLLKRLLRHLTPTGSIRNQAVKSGIWVSLTNVSTRLLQVVMLIVLARLLSPEDFGLMGIALLTLEATRRFTRIGIDSALIQKKESNVDSYFNTAWCLEAARGFLVFLVLFAAAPHIADFFDEPGATSILRVLGVGPVLAGLRNPGVVYFRKELEFHKEFLLETSGAVLQVVVGVAYALYSPTVWALVAGSLSRPATRFALSYVLHGYRPWPSFDVDAARDIIDFGKWITGSSILGWLFRSGDDAFVGWFLSATALGFYQYAYQIADMPATEMAHTVSRVMFPSYSQVQDNLGDLRQALLQSTRFVAFLAFPMGFGIVFVAPSFVPVFLGEEWMPMITTMQILAIFGLIHAITSNFNEVCKSMRRPDLPFKIGIVRIASIALFIWPATARWGIEGAALVVTVGYGVTALLCDVYVAARLTETRITKLYWEYVYPFVASIGMFGALSYTQGLVDVSPFVEILVFVPAGVLIYAAIASFLELQFDWGIRNNLETIVEGIRS